MAEIQDNQGFKIRITPEYTNWWSYYIEFFYKDKPLFNSEIMRGAKAKADEYQAWALLPMLEKAVECHTPDQVFGWGEWEDEAAIVVGYKKWNPLADDGFFVIEAFISAFFFTDGDGNTWDQPAGLRLMMIYRDELKKFYHDLNLEMAAVVRSLNPPRQINGSQPVGRIALRKNRASQGSGKRKVMMIDPDSFGREMYEKKFQEAGFDFTGLDYADENFLEKVVDLQPDVISLAVFLRKYSKDGVITMPGGFEVLKLLKGDQRTAEIPVFFLTDMTEQKYIDQAGSLGAEKYLIVGTMAADDVVKKFSQYLETQPD